MEHSSNSLVSVIIPAYNAEDFIGKTLESVIAQTYRNLEILVIDDGSGDRTASIVEEYIQKDSRIQLFHQTNAGVAAARNLGIEKSKGEFIAPIDADDIWYPQNIEKQVQCLVCASEEVGLVYSWSVDIDEEDKPTGTIRASRIQGQVYTTLLLHYFVGNASSVLIRRNCLEKLGLYNTTLKQKGGQGVEDWEICLRIAERYEFRVVPEFLVGYRQLPNSMSKDFSVMALSHQLIWQGIQQKHPNIPKTIERLSKSSFYMYLAHECERASQQRNALYWLLQALKIDIVTPWLRLGTYKLVAKWCLSMVYQILNRNHKQFPLKKPGELNIKVLAEQILHKLAPRIFGNPHQWQN